MFSEDDIDPHRDPLQIPVAAQTDDSHEASGAFWTSKQTNVTADSSRDDVHVGNGEQRAPTPPPESAKQPAPLLSFSVGRIVDRSKRVPGYTFDVTTNLSSYRRRKYTGIERNQVEFERLEAHLRGTYPECLVPTLGPGTTVSKYVPDYQNDRLVVMLLQQWLSRVSIHPILRQDYELRQFVEAPFAFNPALAPVVPQPPQSNTGFFSWGKSKQKISHSTNPTPFEQHLEKTSDNLALFGRNLPEARRWHGRLARTRTRLSVDLRDVGNKLTSVGVIEHNPQLARTFKRFGKSFVHMGHSAQMQANMEGSRTIAVEDIYTISCENVQKTLMNRQVIFTEHQVAQHQLERKRQSVAVLRASSSISPEQVQATLDEFNVAKADADGKQERAERVDRVLAADLQAFEANRERDFQDLFATYAKDQLQVEKQILSELKSVLDFIRQGSVSGAKGPSQDPPAAGASHATA